MTQNGLNSFDSYAFQVRSAAQEVLPDLEVEHLMRQRPLNLSLAQVSPGPPRPGDLVRRQGLATFRQALQASTTSELLHFVHAEHRRCLAAVQRDAALLPRLFSPVQTPQGRWDLRLPMAPVVYRALSEALAAGTGAALEDLAGPDAELWELGVISTQPGAPPQAVHCDAPRRCALEIFVAMVRFLRCLMVVWVGFGGLTAVFDQVLSHFDAFKSVLETFNVFFHVFSSHLMFLDVLSLLLKLFPSIIPTAKASSPASWPCRT